ncbi:MAG: hypothetical protein IJ874_08245 [Ruminococcus sp.]|nr:hypothetical protein [Ruminococcus sp.]
MSDRSNNGYKLRAVLGDEDSTKLAELQALLNEEISKPEDCCDYDYIAEITQSIAELAGGTLTESEREENIDSILRECTAERKRKRITGVRKWLSAAAACAVFVLGLNFYTLATFGTDIITTAVRLTTGGFSVDFSKQPYEPQIPAAATTTQDTSEHTHTWTTSTLPATFTTLNTTADDFTDTTTAAAFTTAAATDTADITQSASTTAATGSETAGLIETPTVYVRTEPDTDLFPDGWDKTYFGRVMKDVCSGYDISPAAPDEMSYIDMELVDYSHVQLETSEDFYFTFGNPYQQLDIIMECYGSRANMPELMIPSDSTEYDSGRFDIGTAYFFSDAEYNTAVFADNSVVYTIIGQNISSEALKSIVASFRNGG